MGRFLARLIRNRAGSSAIEYAIIASVISVAAIVAFQNLGNSVEDRFDESESAFAQAAD